MSDITFTGLASGLPTSDIVTKLMAVERAPLDRLYNEKTNEANRLKAYSDFNTTLNDLRTAVIDMNVTSKVRTTKINLPSDSPFSATSNGAIAGSYNIAVSQLAQVQKDISSAYASKTTSIFGTGTININDTVIAINSENNSLAGLMAAINDVSDTTGVSANIINDGTGTTPYRLILTGKDASTAFTVTSSLVDESMIPIPFTTTPTQTAQQAKFTVDNIEIVSNSNTITDVIDGVTLNLNKTSAISDTGPPIQYTATKMDVVADSDALKAKISTFVSKYNQVMEWIVSSYGDKTTTTTDPATNKTTTTTNVSTLLRGDVTINTVKRGLQSLLTDVVKNSGPLNIISEIGISTNLDGTLTLDSEDLDEAISIHGQEGMVKLLAGDDTTDGVMKKFNSYLLDITSKSQGMYAQKKDRQTSRIDQLDQDIAYKTSLYDRMEATMKLRFTAMEKLISSLNSLSSYLTQLSELNRSN
ncbi:MAG: flagellar filament capping protein FliD [Proteobacteria bacterium]|nr:flagellar filament capping protein FliD [Pseudomonadota bacterium]